MQHPIRESDPSRPERRPARLPHAVAVCLLAFAALAAPAFATERTTIVDNDPGPGGDFRTLGDPNDYDTVLLGEDHVLASGGSYVHVGTSDEVMRCRDVTVLDFVGFPPKPVYRNRRICEQAVEAHGYHFTPYVPEAGIYEVVVTWPGDLRSDFDWTDRGAVGMRDGWGGQLYRTRVDQHAPNQPSQQQQSIGYFYWPGPSQSPATGQLELTTEAMSLDDDRRLVADTVMFRKIGELGVAPVVMDVDSAGVRVNGDGWLEQSHPGADRAAAGLSILHADANDPANTVTFVPELEPGCHDVFVRWPQWDGESAELSERAVIRIHANDTEFTAVRSQAAAGDLGKWHPVGRYEFGDAPTVADSVSIQAGAGDGTILAEAVAFVPSQLRSGEDCSRPMPSAPQVGAHAALSDVGGDTPDPLDWDSDGVPDDYDNCIEVRNEDQIDGDLDGFGNACDADFNNDGVVGAPDSTLFMRSVGLLAGDPGYDPALDLNGDGAIGGPDMPLFQALYGSEPGPSGWE